MRYYYFNIVKCLSHVLSLCLIIFATPKNISALTPNTLMMGDTTVVACGTQDAYENWIDNKQLAIIVEQSVGPTDSMVIVPSVFTNFSFTTPCNDTVSHLVEIFDLNENLTFSETLVLIVMDTTPPLISNSLSDTTLLSCMDMIPDSTSVTITDNCALAEVTYREQSVSGGNCPLFQQIERVWTATDSCGNMSTYKHTIIVDDDQSPTFLTTPPLKDTVGCLADAHPDFTGYPTAADNCDTMVNITFVDLPQNLSNLSNCLNNRKITRIWTAVDDCSNTITYFQEIFVIDTIPPEFIGPRDTIIGCEFGDAPIFTGIPEIIQNDCDSLTTANISFRDQVSTSTCDNNYSVVRTWYVFDNCGNIDSTTQRIEVVDTVAPTFQTEAQDLILNCTLGLDLDSVYNNWINSNGGALAVNNCALDNTILWQALITGTSDTASFPMRTCQGGDQIILEQSVDFIAIDVCGNRDTTTAQFLIVDDLAPVLGPCPVDTTISAVADTCLGAFWVTRPSLTDECSADTITYPGLQFAYRVNGDSLQLLDGDSVLIYLPLGDNMLSYIITDCGGNQDSCSFAIMVTDQVPPIINCPNDTTFYVGAEECAVDFLLPLPEVSDNCEIDTAFLGPRPIYSASGATQINRVKMDSIVPTHTFNLGTTEVEYIIRDAAGNEDTCIFKVNVVDTLAPIALCQPTTIFINPSGLDLQQVTVGDVDAGSSDNCGIDTMFLTPSTFNCEVSASTTEDVFLTVRDLSGNISRCTTFVRIENLEPEPIATTGLCSNDTLFLNANPPPADGGTVYTYLWTGPNGFTSTKEAPVIPNISDINAGSYAVEITGLTGCKSTGAVEVTVEAIPQTPELIALENYCVNSFVTLQSSIAPGGAQVIYRWYKGNAPNGTLLAETLAPSYSFTSSSTPSSEEYYLSIEADGCTSQNSLPKRITINDFPTAIPQDTTITVCSGETVILGTQVIGNGLTYQWTGPNGYNEAGQFPNIIEEATLANDGIYSLIISRNGCASAPAFVRVNVIQSPAQPMLSNNGPVCERDSVILSTNARATIYHWIAPNLSEFSTSSPTFILSEADKGAEGDWQLYITDFDCDSEMSELSTVIINDLPNTVAASSPDVICEGGELNLNASPNIANASYAWSGPDNFIGAGRNVLIENVRPIKSGRYTVTITTESGCSSSADIDVEVNNSVRIIAASNNGPNCLSGPTDILLNAVVFPEDDGLFKYSWIGPNGFVSNIKEAVIPNATADDNGNYQLVVTNGDGCVSEPGLTVVDVSDPPPTPEQPAISDLTPAPFCVGSSLRLSIADYNGTSVSYHWDTPNDGIIITEMPFLELDDLQLEDSGDYSVFVNVDGCNSNPSSPYRVAVNQRPLAVATSNSPVCAGANINLQANFIADATYNWVGPNISSSSQNPNISGADSAMHTGVYELRVEKDGCISETATTFVQIDPAPMQPQLIGNSPICGSDTNALLRINLNTNNNSENTLYIWEGPNGVLDTTSNQSLDIRDFSSYPEGVNLFRATALLGECLSIPSEALNAVINKIPESKAFAGIDFSSCETEMISLNAEAPAIGSGRWQLVSEDTSNSIIINNPSLPQTGINGLSGNQDFIFEWTLSNGACENYSSDQVVVSINKVENANAGIDQIACASKSITLSAEEVGSQSFWTQPDAQSLFGVQILNPGEATTEVTGLQPGNVYSFTWNVLGSCGNAKDDVLILISDPNPFAGPDVIACNEEGFAQLNADVPAEGSVGTWYAVQAGVQISSDQSPSTIVSNLSPGTYQFVWEMDNGICGNDARDTVEVVYKQNPIVNPESFEIGFGEPRVINILENDIFPEQYSVNIIQAPNHGSLTDLGGGDFEFKPSFDFVGTDRLVYEVCSQACECVLGETELLIGLDAQCDIPNIITPNNDGVNDAFIVPCLFDDVEFPNSQLIIVSRWGDEVYRSSRPYKNDWRGTYNGEDLPVGTYFYILDLGNGQVPESSFFLIQR